MRLAKIIFSALVGVAALAGAAFAHVSLKSTNIAAGAVIETLPKTFAIAFSQPVGLAAFTLETGKGAPVVLDYAPPKGMHAEFSIPLPRLAPGVYLAKWRTISKDGHAMAGEAQFTLAEPKAP